MKKKHVFHTEAAYLLGLALIALGAACMERADFGMSMIVAPAYLLYLKISQIWPAFTFGMAEYTLQGVLLVVMCLILGKFKRSYLFSFVTAVLYGLILDGCMALVAAVGGSGLAARVLYYLVGAFLSAVGVALVFHTYIAPEVYELFVKELAEKTGARIERVKTLYDCASLLLGVALSFAFFGLWHFEGVKAGTLLVALVNGTLIGWISAWLERVFFFRDALPLRHFFDK